MTGTPSISVRRAQIASSSANILGHVALLGAGLPFIWHSGEVLNLMMARNTVSTKAMTASDQSQMHSHTHRMGYEGASLAGVMVLYALGHFLGKHAVALYKKSAPQRPMSGLSY